MCPDRQILSVYFDNELYSPWKEKLEAHLKDCPQCRAALEDYGRAREAFLADTLPVQKAGARIWEQCGSLDYRPLPAPRKRRGIWSRSLRIPVPAAAAGLVLVLAAALFIVLRPAPASEPQLATMGMDVQGMLPVSDMASLLQYLGGESSPDVIIINLPETTFRSAGEPTVLRTADYPRGNRTP
jgi:anti-sigma factor RsiW